MGICGTGKSSVAGLLAARTGRGFVEADDHHSAEAIARMARGEALTDDDRWGWLDRVAQAALAEGRPTAIACSALKRAYRDRLSETLGEIDVIHLDGARDLVARRMADRAGHFMPVSLIDSQLSALEPPAGARVLRLDIDQPLDALVAQAVEFTTPERPSA
ncbi:gluconokinase [Mesobaculum littorinae]|uniref:Gluconokinase n=2 Tax=Mesobaculum littorinae TaxID=2486419 RepID=A0A438AMY1_9RHOB|nr:gluconokinase [Mesobaculum littorinae]